MTARRIRLGSNPRSGLAAGSHRLHSQMDAGPVSVRGKIAGRETLAINPLDARSRGIGDGEVVRVFNARGACFAGVSVTEAVRPASFGSPAAPGTTPRATRTSRPAPILPSSRQPSRDPAPQPAGYPDKADAAERFRPTLRWREVDSNRQSRRRTPFSEAGGDRPARWPEPDFDDRRGQIYLVPCRACSDNDINAGSPSFRKDANAGPCQPARFRALARRVPGDSVLRSPIFETPRSVDTTITPSRMISRIRPTILSTA